MTQDYYEGERILIGIAYLDVVETNGQGHITVRWRKSNAASAVLSAEILNAMGARHCATWKIGDTVQTVSNSVDYPGLVYIRTASGWGPASRLTGDYLPDEEIDSRIASGMAKRIRLEEYP